MGAVKETPRAARQSSPRQRSLQVGKWVENLEKSDVSQLWADLHRIVCYHPLVRASSRAGLLVEDNSRNTYKDLTQELFVVLLSKERFQHYLTTEMSNSEIELEIGQIELTNLLTAELRKRYPESYRLARRVSTLVQTSRNFRRFDNSAALKDGVPSHRRLAQRVYGLSYWEDSKSLREQAELEQRISQVPMRRRDTRRVGCTGDAQIVINNADLEELIIKVLDTIDSPVDIRTLRTLVMSRLPVMDIYLVPIGGDDDDSESMPFEPVDLGENPEQKLLSREAEHHAANSVDCFLQTLNDAVRGKTKQYNRILNVLWHCYLSAASETQLEIAATLGVSDSLVSEYRRRIETHLQELKFTEVEQARQFEQALRTRIRPLIENSLETNVAAANT